MLKVPDKETSQSIQRKKEDKILNNNLKARRSTPARLPRTGWRIYPSTSSSSSSQWQYDEWKSNQSCDFGDLQPGLRETCGTSPNKKCFRHDFSLVQFVVFRLPATFSSQATDGECEQNTFPHCMYRHKHFVCTSHMMTRG